MSSLRSAILVVAVAWGVLTLIGLYGTMKPPRVEETEIELPGLPPELDGLRVVQVSDPHLSWWNSKREWERTCELVKELNPDLLAVTGDIADHHPGYVEVFADGLEEVEPRFGRYAVLGNHDIYTGREAVARRLERRGFVVLRNECRGVPPGRPLFALAGLEDSGMGWTGRDPWENRLRLTFYRCPKDLPVILLSHRPPGEESIRRGMAALTLSGHTHGGQFRLPFGGPGLADLTFEHSAGLSEIGGKYLYVSRGLGTVGWPFRLFCPPELTLLILRSPGEGEK